MDLHCEISYCVIWSCTFNYIEYSDLDIFLEVVLYKRCIIVLIIVIIAIIAIIIIIIVVIFYYFSNSISIVNIMLYRPA